MQCTRAGLCSSLPLSLEGPKGEGDQGGEGSPVGPGRCAPKSDTNPLTLPEHQCYYPHRSNTNPTISRRNHNPGGTTAPAPEDSTSKPIPKGGSHAAPRHKQTPPSPLHRGPGSPSPQPSGDGRSIDSKQHVGLRDRPTRRTSHPARSSQRYAHSPRIYGALQCRARQGPSRPRLRLHRRSLRRFPPTQRRMLSPTLPSSEW